MKKLRLVLLLAMLPFGVHAGQDWSIDWYSMDGGGTMQSSGGSWELAGTIGQPDATAANALSGGGWKLTGGFWGLIAEVVDTIFSDRFQAQMGEFAPSADSSE